MILSDVSHSCYATSNGHLPTAQCSICERKRIREIDQYDFEKNKQLFVLVVQDKPPVCMLLDWVYCTRQKSQN